MIVLDASVAAKWVLTELETGVALELLDGATRCAAPEIIKLEVAGAVLRRFRLGSLSTDQARAACDDWERLVGDSFVRLIGTDELYEAAVTISLDIRHAFPDCLYLAAARMLDCPLITADETLYERGRAVHDRIELLRRAA